MSGRRSPRAVAVHALLRVDEGAYLNLALPALLEGSGLERRDRAFATELAYGTTRMRRACDWLVDRHLRRPVEPAVRAALRLGAYQLAFLGTPPHAAVSATVEEVPPRARGLANAVLRRVADGSTNEWPDEATRLSYPDWVVDRLVSDLGSEPALAVLAEMDRPALVMARPDGYVQDESSQMVASLVGAGPGETILDLCAAPGGKATGIAGTAGGPAAGPSVVAAVDISPARARLVRDNARRLGMSSVVTLVADGRRPPMRRGIFDRVLVDAPCSGLGALARRPDARWRISENAVDRLVSLQRELMRSASGLVRPRGTLVFSVCTLTRAETLDMDAWAKTELRGFDPLPVPDPPWRGHGRGALLLPGAAGSDGMYCLRLRAPEVPVG